MDLARPLSQKQIDSAGRVYCRLKQWCLADSTLAMVAAQCPGFSAEACLLKTVAVNSIYGTQLLATLRMAAHIKNIFDDPARCVGDLGLVERIATLPAKDGEKPRLLISFASKFCHFFVNPDTFPIYDEAAREALKLHLGASHVIDKATPYVSFCKNLDRLRALAKLKSTTNELDRYLWLTGMAMRWQKEKAKKNPRVNAELKQLLQQPSQEIRTELEAMLPELLAGVI